MKNADTDFLFSIYSESGEGRLVTSRTDEKTMQIIEVLYGNVVFRIGTKLIEAEAGDFVYIPPTFVFRADAVGSKASLRAICFSSAILESNMENFDAEVFYMFHIQSMNNITSFKAGHPVYSVLSKYMQESYDENAAKDLCYKLPICANIYLMMTSLLRYYCGSKDEQDRMIYHNVLRLRPVMEYIAEHYCEKIYIEKLADMINVSSDYFTKMFKDSIGTTPIDYINSLRVNESMRLLSESERPMADISEHIGFCNPNYFHKIFKQYMNTSPLAYRKSTKI